MSQKESLKDQIICPFAIKFVCINKINRIPKKDNMYCVIVTEVHCTHHCELSNEFLHVANRSSRRRAKYDLKKLESVVTLLKNNLKLCPMSLKPILSECLPAYFHLGHKFIGISVTELYYIILHISTSKRHFVERGN